jgi:rhamnosyltransferase
MNDTLALGFILFNPSKDAVTRISDSARSGYEIFIFLNSPVKEEFINVLKSVESIHILSNGLNEGLARGLSSLCNAASLGKFRALLYFDQDSIFTLETLNYVEKYLNIIKTSDDSFIDSIVSTTFRDTTTLSRRYNHISTFQISGFQVENVYFTINSGSLYFLNKMDKYEWFDKRYFVDGVDYSFCIRSKINDFKITEIFNTPGLDHETEQGNLPVKFFNKEKSGRLYPFSRNIDFLKSHLMILWSTLKIRSIKPKIFILKSILSYLYTQLLFRLKSIRQTS